MLHNELESSLKQILGAPHRDLGGGEQNLCTSNKFTRDVDAAGLETTLCAILIRVIY